MVTGRRCWARSSSRSKGAGALQGQRQAAQGCWGNAGLSSWAAVDTGKEAGTKSV